MSNTDKSSRMNLKGFAESKDAEDNERMLSGSPKTNKGATPKRSNRHEDEQEDLKTKKKRKEKVEEHKQKDLNVNKYRGLTMYPKLNEIYGEEYTGADEADCYSGYLSCCGQVSRGICFLCATCRCGPLVEISQGQVGIVLEFGKFVRKVGPGLHSYNSCTEEIVTVDMRMQSLGIPTQDLITKDNICVKIDCFVLFKILIPEMACFRVADYRKFISYTTMGTMKTIIAEKTLTDLLAHEDEIEAQIREIIDDQCDDFGIHVDCIETKKIQVAPNMVSAMATIALSEKEMEAKIINAKGDYESSRIFREAADELSKNPLSLQLHYFETLKNICENTHPQSTITLMPDVLIDTFM